MSALAVPGVGPVLAAGPLAAALIGAGVGAAAGGLIGALTDIGIPEEHAHYYSEGVRRGGVLVTVATTDAMAEQAVAILSRHNPIDISRWAEEWRQSGWSCFDPQAAPYRAPAATASVRAEEEREAQPARAFAAGATPSLGTLSTTTPRDVEVGNFEAYEARFRRHFNTAFVQHGATYDTYMPAYRYGYPLASDARYGHRDWDAIAPEAQRDWEREHPGTWERFKAAIQHAWNEVRGRR